MTQNSINVTASTGAPIKVNVTAPSSQGAVTLSQDTSAYNAEIARQWAISDKKVLQEDYSSKYYANKAKDSENSAKNYANVAETAYNIIQDSANGVLADIETARVDAVDNITTVKSESIASVEAKGNEVVSTVNEGIAEINDTKTDAVNTVNTSKNEALNAINQIGVGNLANKDLSNLSAIGEARFASGLNDKITNCILEKPQRIKVEAISSTGKLILKAGSIVSVSENGTFEDVVITEDVSRGSTHLFTETGNRDLLACYVPSINEIINIPVAQTYSQATAPTTFLASLYGGWYDTTNNIMKYTYDGGTTWTVCSLPFAYGNPVFIRVGTGWAGHIKQVFNGFGFVGSTTWADKGVEMLLSNGRNADGTLNNTVITTDKIHIRTMSYSGEQSHYLFWLKYTDRSIYTTWGGQYIVSETEPSHSDTSQHIMWYNPATNLFKQSNAGGEFFDLQATYIGICEKPATGNITQFKPIQPFRAVDYSEYLDTPKVIETYVNGYSGYRIWSPDQTGRKRCQQWGSIQDSSGGEKTITFLNPFADNKYFIVKNVGTNYAGQSISNYESCYSLTTTSFKTKYANDYTQGADNRWYAVGYID